MIRRQRHLEEACLAEFDPPIALTLPETRESCAIFCSPHSGNHYPADFISRSDQPLSGLRRNEDAFIDKLFAPTAIYGAPLLAARFPRSFVDVNRAEDELPQKWLPRGQTATMRADSGLGVIPLALGQNQPIYRRPLRASAVKARIETLYRPYHAALRALLRESQEQFGRALLVDCHSMPGFSISGTRRADIILGDRYGTSCRPETISRIEALFTALQYSVTRNYPYAGSYVTSHYGQPHDGVEALQIEINRDLYLNPVTLKPKRDYERLAEDLDVIIRGIISSEPASSLMAAE